MKKKLLFIIPSHDSGGAEKSLVNLLNMLDYGRFEVDLLLLNRHGIFLDALPETVRLVALPANLKVFSKPLASSVKEFVADGRFDLAFHRFAFALRQRVTGNLNLAEQKAWKHVKKCIGVLPKHYDTAIGFLEKTSIYCCVDCVKANKKLGFIRTDYSQLGLDEAHDQRYFDQLDYLCANGHESLRILQDKFPKLNQKLKIVLNVVSPAMIRQMASAPIDLMPGFPTLLSIGRLKHVKGFDLAIEAAAILKQKQIDFRWFIVGEGAERQALELLIQTSQLANHVILLGEKSNPYPYLQLADIYVQTSRFEGRSSTVNEAKIMGKPIVSTDFDSVFELLQNNENALIVSKSAEAIAEGIEKLIRDESLRGKFVAALQQTSLSTEAELEKFYALL